MNNSTASSPRNGSEIAIIGMGGRFPEAKNIDEFWKNLQNGIESISFFTDEELLSSGISSSVLSDPNYVKAQATLKDVEFFDASFFGFNPREAEITDPQHRLFLECAWEALESAGYNSETYKGSIGVYAGSSLSDYLIKLYLNQNTIQFLSHDQLVIGCDKDYLTTRVSYKLNLDGPSYTVQTACSTSLVAVHLACQSLLNGESDIALAGGVSIRLARKAGYFYTEGGIQSPDGHCRAFDAKAQGTVSGEGVGIVVLKRLEEALADGDCIHAVIKGSAINNDGSFKVSYTAPRIDTQAKVIRTAQIIAEVEPQTITYIEAHGTATPIGDPIEIAALTQAFRDRTRKKGFCAIGSVKTNIGHLDAAAGVAGLIKTTLALKHKQIPPSLHFQEPSPQIDFINSPFYVNNSLSDWKTNINGIPRRAGVSSFGIGGTNAHVILEEAPVVEPSGSSRPWQLLLFSAKTSTAIKTVTTNIAAHLQQHTLNLADVAYTLKVGRRAFNHRRMVVCQNLDDAVKVLSSEDPQQVFTHYQESCNRPVVFMFSGQGAQYVNMGRELYQSEPIFREQVDQCCEVLKPHIGLDLRTVLYPSEQQAQQATQQLLQTAITQPALFVIEYALAQLWMVWGVQPEAMIGHSIGEYVAATLAGVFSLEDALALVAQRGKLMQQLPTGAMLSVQLPEDEVQPLLEPELSLAASNSPSSCVVSGSTEAVEKLQQQLQQKGAGCRRLHTSHAFHSQMMEPIIDQYTQNLQLVKLNPPQIPFVSNVSGTWITQAEATDPNYWATHLRQPVRFSEGVTELFKQPKRIFLEVGSGRTLSTFTKQHQQEELIALTSLRHPQEQQSDVAFLLNTLGRLWLFGVQIDWSSFYTHERRHRIPLPTYPFERQRYWIETNPETNLATVSQKPLHKKQNIADWFYVPSWKHCSLPVQARDVTSTDQKSCWLVFIDDVGVGSQIAKQLEQQGHDVITVTVGEQFTKQSDRLYAINPQASNDYDALLKELSTLDLNPNAIAHFWSLTPNKGKESPHQFFDECQNLGFYSLLFLVQALGKQEITDSLQILAVTNNVQEVNGDEKLCPEKTTVLGICKVIPQEYSNITCRSIDIVIPELRTSQENQLIDQLLAEFTHNAFENVVAYRSKHRWVQTFEPVQLEKPESGTIPLREGGVYLITGGLGGIGLVLAEYLAQTVRAKLVLTGRSGLPQNNEWSQWLATHDENDHVSRKIKKVQALEALGAQVLVCSADIAHEEQMRAVMSQASKRFGQIHGVIHAAGIGGGGLIQFQTPEKVASVFASKVKGTQVLDILFKDVQLDFLVLCSSHISILAGPGRVDYCTANAFLDAFAHHNTSRHSPFTVSINWENWLEVGMSVDEALRQNLKPEEVLANAMSSKEGVDAFSRILCKRLPQVIVSPENFHVWIERSNANFASVAFSALERVEKARPSKPVHPRPQLSNAYVAPRNEVEQTFADIWQQLIGIKQIGIHDNFFDLGGDSLVGILVSAKSHKAGFRINPQQIFEHQTIAELAAVADTTQVIQAEQGLVTDLVPLAPMQHWFFEQNQPQAHHWNQAVLLEALQVIDAVLLEQAFRQILVHHDALRLRFMYSESGWQQVNASPEEVIPFTRLDLSAFSREVQKSAIETTAAETQASLNLSTGPIVRVVLFELDANSSSRLLVVIHHLAVDFGSWRILLEDIQSAYQQLSQGQTIQLPQKTTSFKQWSFQLKEYAHLTKLQQEMDYWLRELNKQVSCLPMDYPRGINTVASVQTVSVAMNAEETQALLQEIPSLYRTNIQEVLLTALAQAFAQWTGVNSLLVDLEGNGREATIDHVDISRTVGWFTTIYPVLLDLENANNPGDALKVVKEQLRCISNQGIDYGVLRYLSKDVGVTEKIRSLPQAEVIFLYLGQFGKSLPQSTFFRPTGEFSGPEHSPQGTRSHLLEVTGSVTEDQLALSWKYSSNVHRRETIEKLSHSFVEALKSLIIHSQYKKAGGYIPSDFSAAKISQENLSKLLAQAGQSDRENS